MEHVEGALNFLRKPDPVSKPRLSSFAFGPWSNWSNCSENCGIGEKSRTRKCTANVKVSCPADGTCNDDACVYESKQCEIKCLTCASLTNYCDSKEKTECTDVSLAKVSSFKRLNFCFKFLRTGTRYRTTVFCIVFLVVSCILEK